MVIVFARGRLSKRFIPPTPIKSTPTFNSLSKDNCSAMPYSSSNDFIIGARQRTEGNRKLFLMIKTSIDSYVTAPRTEKAFLRYLVLQEFGGQIFEVCRESSSFQKMKKVPIKEAIYRPDLIRVFQNQGKYYKLRLGKRKVKTRLPKNNLGEEDIRDDNASVEHQHKQWTMLAEMARSQCQHAKLYSSIFKGGEYEEKEDPLLLLPGQDDPFLISRANEWDRIDTEKEDRNELDWYPRKTKKDRTEKRDEHNTHATTLRQLKEAPGATTSTSFPPQRKRLGRTLPRIPLCTTLSLKDTATSDTELVGVVRQILYSPTTHTFVYYVVSHQRALPSFTQRYTEIDILDMLSDGRAYEIKPPPRTTKSTVTSDVYTEVPCSIRQMQSPWGTLPPCPRRYFATKIERERLVGELKERVCVPAVSQRLEEYIKESYAILEALPKEQQPDRLQWKSWVPTRRQNRWHIYQHLLLALTTNIENDSIVKLAAPRLFQSSSPLLDQKNKFDNPISVCQDPHAVFRLITRKGKEAETEGLGKGMVYCNEKAKAIIIASKQLVLKTYARLTNMDEFSVLRKLCHYHDHSSLIKPIPDSVLDYVEASGDSCFPRSYVDHFFKNVYGIGLKMRHLIAEGAYGVNYGILLDRHTKRFAVELGLVPAAYNDEQMNAILVKLLPSSLYPALNEIPASISQRLQSRKWDNVVLIRNLGDVATKHGWGYHFTCFLRHYPAIRSNDGSIP